jgi:signal transduction histidine kinase
MIATQAKTVFAGSVESKTILQLLICQSLVFAVALVSGSHALPILGACLLSFLLMLNIPFNLHLLEITLERLVRGLPVEPAPLRLRWPLTNLFALVNALGQQTGQQVEMRQSNLAYRDQLLQQVGKAAAQEERNRLARDLHDSIKQQIFSIAVSAAAIKARWESDLSSVRKIVDDIERVALEAQVEMQALLQQLRPIALENVGLIDSLRMQCQALVYRTGAEVSVELGDLPGDELLPLGATEAIFRIVQEGFANIARHARASYVWLSLRQQRDALLVEIGDDGQGFNLARANEWSDAYGGMGLSNVRERVRSMGGTLTVWSKPGKGTTLHMCIPLVRAMSESQEQHISRSLATAIRRPRRILRAGMLAAEAAAVFVLLYTPPWIALLPVGICTLLALICLLWSQRYGSQLAVEFGHRDSPYLLFRAERYGLLTVVLLLCMLWPNYLAVWFYPSYFAWISSNVWLAIGLAGIFITAILATSVRCLQNLDGYAKTLSYQELQARLRQQREQIAVDVLAWAVGAALAIFLLHVFPLLSRDPVVYKMGMVVISAWLIAILLKSAHIVRWQHVLRRLARPALQEQKGDSI